VCACVHGCEYMMAEGCEGESFAIIHRISHVGSLTVLPVQSFVGMWEETADRERERDRGMRRSAGKLGGGGGERIWVRQCGVQGGRGM
jgi:hypothetical protein